MEALLMLEYSFFTQKIRVTPELNIYSEDEVLHDILAFFAKTSSLDSSEIKRVFKTFTTQDYNIIKLHKLQGTDIGSYLLLQHPNNKFSHITWSQLKPEAQRCRFLRQTAIAKMQPKPTASSEVHEASSGSE